MSEEYVAPIGSSRFREICESILADSFIRAINKAYFESYASSESVASDFESRVNIVLSSRILEWLYMINNEVIIEKVPEELASYISLEELASIINGYYIKNLDCVHVKYDTFLSFLNKKVNKLKGLLSLK